ncbi:MAG: hypothetical protein IJ713_02545 [Oscillibacter sp.]|nr:hypothetical protein [Oscillibacter sp.]
MSKVINIVETKIMKRNGVDVERVIFSNDKIVYVRLDNGEVYPKDTPDRYVDLISYYNAAHNGRAQRMQDSLNWASEHTDDFLEDISKEKKRHSKSDGFIKDGTGDRQAQINKTKRKNLRELSKNHQTQTAINSMINFGEWLFVGGLLQILIYVAILIAYATGVIEYQGNIEFQVLSIMFGMIVGLISMIVGDKQKRLGYSPTGIRVLAVTIIILAAIILLSHGAVGIVGIIIGVKAIISLVKVGRYENWYYGEIE